MIAALKGRTVEYMCLFLAGHESQTAYIYVTRTDYDMYNAASYKRTQPELDKTRVGIISFDTKHPFPKGLCIPYKLTNYGPAEHRMDDLTGEFIFNQPPQPK